jgi:hypothetical protein
VRCCEPGEPGSGSGLISSDGRRHLLWANRDGSEFFVSVPRLASVLRPLPLYASGRGARLQGPMMKDKDLRDQGLPPYASWRCQFILQGKVVV